MQGPSSGVTIAIGMSISLPLLLAYQVIKY